jgi:ABC-2 type transport system permease protein
MQIYGDGRGVFGRSRHRGMCGSAVPCSYRSLPVAATLTALGFESRSGVRRIAPGATGLFGRGLAHLTIYASALALFFVVLPRIYGFSTLGRVADLALFAVPFVLATSYGTGCGQLF